MNYPLPIGYRYQDWVEFGPDSLGPGNSFLLRGDKLGGLLDHSGVDYDAGHVEHVSPFHSHSHFCFLFF